MDLTVADLTSQDLAPCCTRDDVEYGDEYNCYEQLQLNFKMLENVSI